MLFIEMEEINSLKLAWGTQLSKVVEMIPREVSVREWSQAVDTSKEEAMCCDLNMLGL